jgi:hypothetical protein
VLQQGIQVRFKDDQGLILEWLLARLQLSNGTLEYLLDPGNSAQLANDLYPLTGSVFMRGDTRQDTNMPKPKGLS